MPTRSTTTLSYLHKNRSGEMTCVSMKSEESLKPVTERDLDDFCYRIDRCIDHSDTTQSSEIVVWNFKSGRMLSEQQAEGFHNLLLANEDVESHCLCTSRDPMLAFHMRQMVIKTIHNTQIILLLACGHSQFFDFPCCAKPKSVAVPVTTPVTDEDVGVVVKAPEKQEKELHAEKEEGKDPQGKEPRVGQRNPPKVWTRKSKDPPGNLEALNAKPAVKIVTFDLPQYKSIGSDLSAGSGFTFETFED
ncbi:hypothetical protein SEMRO_458_G147180.1 [Seminavis robusta]|uniref:Uncharacterized protein n=1 Tax=Seminavis robusta TaxID=568900 RepID=A0A9N8E2C4_9STRA|nr:hypothetical protein SEMRO_458_G147180.1 [Seminavis robusta]|eukprot:Sro458_g147180.1 n/a (247) ;mRNA; f:60115-60855